MKTRIAAVALAAGLTFFVSSNVLASPGVPGPGQVRAPSPTDDPAGSLPDVTPAAQTKLPPTSTVTLGSGDRVRLDVDQTGGQSVTPAGQGASLGHFTWSGDQYAIPASAVPYLGSTLDPRLFDVSYLVRAGLDDAHSSSLPIKITYTGTGPVPALPGIRVMSRSGTTAVAAITTSDAAKLGQLLADQSRASHTGKSSIPAGHLLGIQRIELAPPSSAPALPAALPRSGARPNAAGLHYRTITVNLIDLNGEPGSAYGFLQNVDDKGLGFSVFGTFPGGDQGPVSFSVPEGTYSLAFSDFTPHADDAAVDTALVV